MSSANTDKGLDLYNTRTISLCQEMIPVIPVSVKHDDCLDFIFDSLKKTILSRYCSNFTHKFDTTCINLQCVQKMNTILITLYGCSFKQLYTFCAGLSSPIIPSYQLFIKRSKCFNLDQINTLPI